MTGVATNLVQFPLLFASTAFVPESALPGWLRPVSAVNPIAHGVDAARAIVLTGWAWDVIGRSLVALGALDLAFGALAVYFLTRASSSAVEHVRVNDHRVSPRPIRYGTVYYRNGGGYDSFAAR